LNNKQRYPDILVFKASLFFLSYPTVIQAEEWVIRSDSPYSGGYGEAVNVNWYLNEINNGTTWILWKWTNPSDSDFNHTEVWVGGMKYDHIRKKQHHQH